MKPDMPEEGRLWGLGKVGGPETLRLCSEPADEVPSEEPPPGGSREGVGGAGRGTRPTRMDAGPGCLPPGEHLGEFATPKVLYNKKYSVWVLKGLGRLSDREISPTRNSHRENGNTLTLSHLSSQTVNVPCWPRTDACGLRAPVASPRCSSPCPLIAPFIQLKIHLEVPPVLGRQR